MGKVCLNLVKLGEFGLEFAPLAGKLQELLGIEVIERGVLELPPVHYREERKQYWVVPLLSLLEHRFPEGLVLGITGADLYEAGLASVLGAGLEQGRAAILSVYRLKEPGSSGPTFLARMLKQALHELGHLFSLAHCEKDCVMAAGFLSKELDLRNLNYCEKCRRLIEQPEFNFPPAFPPGTIKYIYSSEFYAELKNHIFPIAKYRKLYARMLKSGFSPADFLTPQPALKEDLLLVHTPAYLNDLLNLKWSSRTANSELPLNRQVVSAYILAAGGTILAAETALKNGAGFYLGGGFHHAFPDHAEGFCYLNDVAIAVKKLQKEEKVKRVAVIDCDLHQGNGTAFIFKDTPQVFTFSLHQENNYPLKQKSDLDIGLEDGADDEAYFSKLRKNLPAVLEFFSPELLIYLAGADPYQDDQLGGLALSMEGLRQRDELVLGKAFQKRIPVVVLLAGGYARKLEDTVQIHFNTVKVSRELFGAEN